MKYLLILLKGMAMGAADIVPGVSGGTIAFITGIYDRLLGAINAINLKLLKTLKLGGIKSVWESIDGTFLLCLFGGIAISVFSLANLLNYLLETQPILIWSFFFGLIIASIIYVGKQVERWSWQAILGLLLGAVLVFWISKLPPIGGSETLGYIFICGVIAICAMILPGISGSFLLLILGAYKVVLTAVSERNFLIIFTFGAGAIVGLLSFSKFLKWLLDTYRNTTIAVLTGFLVGSLYKVWPWKVTTQFRLDSHGNEVPFIQENIMPNNQIMPAILCAVIGFALLFGIEKAAEILQKKK
jgi:putative membrane protein